MNDTSIHLLAIVRKNYDERIVITGFPYTINTTPTLLVAWRSTKMDNAVVRVYLRSEYASSERNGAVCLKQQIPNNC